MIVYKATDGNGNTRGEMQWGPDVTNTITVPGSELCTKQVIHCYRTPLQAAFFLPIHSIGYSRLWEAETPEIVADDRTKLGVKSCTTIREIELPVITTDQRVEIAIWCALSTYREPGFVEWAKKWLTGEDRSAAAVAAAAKAWAAAAKAAVAALVAVKAAKAWAEAWAEAAALVAEAAALVAEAATANPALDVIAVIEAICNRKAA